MKSIFTVALILLTLLLSQCSFLLPDEAALQAWQLQETPIGTELNVIMDRHKEELTGSNKHWSYAGSGCTGACNHHGEFYIRKKQSGHMIRRVLDIRLYLILPEYVYVLYCFDEHQRLTSVNINVEVDGI
ncbi:hypothetical protein [Marinicella meishanensis]|uniref:hypothetical protein n=1 Tax=Marinicella meishanensis TaxID=2873263 RepID=UPI001CBAE135|nr:hypothetical protein [Marinicella sp. NBU2979]